MKYNVYDVISKNLWEGYDYAIIPEDEVYRFFNYNDESKYILNNTLTSDYNEGHELTVLKRMSYYIELKNGTQLYFFNEANMWKWLYEHHGDLQIGAYGEYNI